MEKLGRIYKATGPTGKVYIGQTIFSLKIRKRKHFSNSKKGNTHFYNAIRKYGWDNFTWEIIHDDCLEKDMNIMEIHYIQLLGTYKNGYNSTIGGRGCSGYKFTEEAKKKMSEMNAGEKHPMYGKHPSEESKRRMSKAQTGLRTGEKNHMYGKHHSSETKKKMSEAQIGSRMGKENPMYGKTHSLETIQKIKKANTGLLVGEKNPNATLTWKIVKEIRKKYATEKYSQKLLAKEYKISYVQTSRIINNKRWIQR